MKIARITTAAEIVDCRGPNQWGNPPLAKAAGGYAIASEAEVEH